MTRSSLEELGIGDDGFPCSRRGRGSLSGTRKSITYVPQDLYDSELAPLDGPLQNRRRSSSRRSAIDLVRTEPSIEFGSGTGMRFSMDSASSGRQYSGSLLTTYTNFATKHRGRNSKILRATNRQDGRKVILKVFDKNTMSVSKKEDVLKELKMLKKAKGIEGIVQLYGSYEDDHYVSFILKDIPRGTLINRITSEGGQMPEDACVREIVIPLLRAVKWLHDHRIVHRDLKPEHILFDAQGSLKLVDFMTSALVGRDCLISREGTLAYMAPEMLTKPTPEEIFHDVICNGIDEAELPCYNEKVDIWSIGVIVVECLTGRQPFLADGAEEMLAVQHAELGGRGNIGVCEIVADQGFLSMEGRDFISRIFSFDPDDRPSAAELMLHPWLELLSPSGVIHYYN